MGLQSHGSSNFENFETKWHLGVGLVAMRKKYYKGEGGGFLQVWAMVNLVSPCVACGSSVHHKCFNFALTNLLSGLCRSMWIIDLLITCPNIHPRALAHPFTLKVLRAREHTPTSYPSVIFTLDSQLSLSRSLGVHQLLIIIYLCIKCQFS
jgi:hypothetical protein